MAKEIKFGTDGWRGIIADDFTFDNVRRVSRAVASFAKKAEAEKVMPRERTTFLLHCLEGLEAAAANGAPPAAAVTAPTASSASNMLSGLVLNSWLAIQNPPLQMWYRLQSVTDK